MNKIYVCKKCQTNYLRKQRTCDICKGKEFSVGKLVPMTKPKESNHFAYAPRQMTHKEKVREVLRSYICSGLLSGSSDTDIKIKEDIKELDEIYREEHSNLGCTCKQRALNNLMGYSNQHPQKRAGEEI